MKKNSPKPSTEAKALSLFLMAYKTINPKYKEQSKRINRLWNLVKHNELDNDEYMFEVNNMLNSNGGYLEVVEKTVKYYIEKTGKWTLEGDDKYCKDANSFVDKYLKK